MALAHQIRVNEGFRSISLPDGNVYDGETEVFLTGEQYAAISDGAFAGDEPILTHLNEIEDPALDTIFSGDEELAAALTVLGETFVPRTEYEAADPVPRAEFEETTEGLNQVYVWDEGEEEYVLSGGRTFIGPNDPNEQGFTLDASDYWRDTGG